MQKRSSHSYPTNILDEVRLLVVVDRVFALCILEDFSKKRRFELSLYATNTFFRSQDWPITIRRRRLQPSTT